MSWHDGIAPAQALVRCGDAVHRLCWAAGHLTAPDHDDIEGERTLAALGGDRCACVDLLDAWERLSADPVVLVVASRGPGDALPPPAEPAHEAEEHGWTSYGPGHVLVGACSSNSGTLIATGSGTRDEEGEEDDELDGLDDEEPAEFRVDPAARARDAILRVGGGIPDRLAATVIAGLLESGGHEAELHAALYGRVLHGLRIWLGRSDLSLTLRLGDDASLTRDAPAAVTATLPLRWLLDVHARGLTIVGDRFTLAVHGAHLVCADLAGSTVRIPWSPPG